MRTRQIVDSVIISRRRVVGVCVCVRVRTCALVCVLSYRKGRGKEEDAFKDLYTAHGKETTTTAAAAATIVRP